MSVRESAGNWFVLADAGSSHEPAFLTSELAIHTADHGRIKLSEGARRCLETPNAGGTSEWSEAISFEVLRRCYGASLKRTEMEIEYRGASKITDFAIQLAGAHLGVSVTRAMSFLKPFDLAEATRLLTKKLDGVIASTRGVIKQHRWSRQILHVLTADPANVAILHEAYSQLDPALHADTLVLVTVAPVHSQFMF